MKPLNRYQVTLTPGEAELPTHPNNLGLRTKFGGLPDWIQSPEVPCCSECSSEMYFVCQIDSFEDQNNCGLIFDEMPKKIDYMFADVGMLYVFHCFECFESTCIQQC